MSNKKIVEGLTQILVEVLNKNPQIRIFIIEEVDTDN